MDAGSETITLQLWLHRDASDAWLVSAEGFGAGVWLPKAEVVVPADAVPMTGGLGHAPVSVTLPRWLAEDRGLVTARDER